MATRLYREYKFKFYLNANHYIIINGKNGQTHPHTWEFVFYIMKSEGEFVLFNKFEKAIEEYLEKFQGRVMNEIPPFDTMVPTLENISDYFCDEIRSIITKLGGELAFMESSETPTRSYIIDLRDGLDFKENMSKLTEKQVDEVMENIIDNILE
ncbi:MULTISPECIES: 6-carboxytetrahydropterin synthase [Clostridia]|uniref:6-carboxy-5,6,7,8-tetrahydropterin synthase n=1 Tax=Butyribacter intestini TaxID=1703332 RepID=A0AAW3JVP2_9FIRM|nr:MULTISPECIES: 6-carboxytetrahydropterin synthase [Clostridia]KQC86148.1 hypothetical protein APZ18_02845 [Butyribacter intestini]RHP25779.1 6-pyruvoyl tetrahydrobiopterin synthase [Clostridium sp. AF34-13]RHU77258.1 6-pyruvoyl tetrahydrobiopterin synthase [Butyribacter intestini]UYJ40083.1 MAG: 6-carboxytetrahydropterin synthase [Lachnospiraceae bacterium]